MFEWLELLQQFATEGGFLESSVEPHGVINWDRLQGTGNSSRRSFGQSLDGTSLWENERE